MNYDLFINFYNNLINKNNDFNINDYFFIKEGRIDMRSSFILSAPTRFSLIQFLLCQK